MNARGWILALALTLLATPAWAQFQECPNIEDVPESLYFTIVNNADVLFGDLSDGVCNGIVNQGKAACRAQSNAAASCFKRSVNANYDIQIKQCEQREDSSDRALCKEEMKDSRNAAREEIDSARSNALAVCDDQFVNALRNTCEGVMPK
jgi:hypothetical protein